MVISESLDVAFALRLLLGGQLSSGLKTGFDRFLHMPWDGNAARRLLLESMKDVDVIVDVDIINAAIGITVVAFEEFDARAVGLGVDMS
jgi:hypothetical protein